MKQESYIISIINVFQIPQFLCDIPILLPQILYFIQIFSVFHKEITLVLVLPQECISALNFFQSFFHLFLFNFNLLNFQ